jgi:hypothetical protein
MGFPSREYSGVIMEELSIEDKNYPRGICFGCGPTKKRGLKIKSYLDGDKRVRYPLPAEGPFSRSSQGIRRIISDKRGDERRERGDQRSENSKRPLLLEQHLSRLG